MIQPRTPLVGLWVGWLLTLLASFVAGWTRQHWWDGARQDLRMISCLLLVVAAWLAWHTRRQTRLAAALLFVAIGMTLGFYGDSHVGDRFWWPPFPQKILGGIVFYGLGHLAYVAACVVIRRRERLERGRRWWWPILAWQLAALAGWAAVALTSDEEPSLRIPTLLYTLLVAATPGFGTALAVQRPAFRALAIGGAMFLISDLLLAWQIFHDSFTGIDELTWVNYGGGEMLIVYGAILGITQALTMTGYQAPGSDRPTPPSGFTKNDGRLSTGA